VESSVSNNSSQTFNEVQKKAIKKLWLIKPISENSVVELRAFKDNFVSTHLFRGTDYFDINDLREDFERQALHLNNIGFNTYYVMNTIREQLTDGSAKDIDITYRNLLLIDIDKVGHKRQSSTDEELEAARLLSEDIAQYLTVEGWDDPIRMMSGNGYHLYYALNKLPNDERTKELVEDTLHELAEKFNNGIVAVDTVVYNASRITKIPGTIARKGENTAERPHRMAVVL